MVQIQIKCTLLNEQQCDISLVKLCEQLCHVYQGPVVRKLISTNPGLKVNQGFNTLV